MSEQPSTRGRTPARVFGHVVVVIGILAVLAAAFALSYTAVRDIALAAGVPVTLARIYPGIFDAMFVVTCAAALTLRDARWWARLYAWLSVLATGALIGAADAYHAMGPRLPHRITAGTIAALPWALAMLGFSLWLSMLRHARPGPARVPAEAGTLYPSVPGGQAVALDATPAIPATPVTRAALPAPEPPAEPASPDKHEAAPAAASSADMKRPIPSYRSGAAATRGAQDDGAQDDDALEDDDEDAAQPAARPHPSDEDTPAYGFPAVEDATTAGDAAGEAHPAEAAGEAEAASETEAGDTETSETTPGPRLPSLLSAPVPADVAARGKPPSATAELPPAQAELAHEDVTKKEPPAGASPPRFERVRSSPTPPAAGN